MPTIHLQAFVPGNPDRVFERVTAFSPRREPDPQALQALYGTLLSQEGSSYSFREINQETKGEGATWQCTFDPPRRRVMRTSDSAWADRVDEFEPSGDGTLWTIFWELKVQGLKAYTQWLGFQFGGRRRALESIVAPVIEHFQTQSQTFY